MPEIPAVMCMSTHAPAINFDFLFSDIHFTFKIIYQDPKFIYQFPVFIAFLTKCFHFIFGHNFQKSCGSQLYTSNANFSHCHICRVVLEKNVIVFIIPYAFSSLGSILHALL